MKVNESYFTKIIVAIILAGLLVLAFLLVRPILLSIVSGFILAFIFSPVYNRLNKKIKSKNLSAAITTIFLIVLILLPFILLTPLIIDESINIFVSSGEVDLVSSLNEIFPSLFSSEEFAARVDSTLKSFITRLTGDFINSLADFLASLPIIFLQFSVVMFTFFFAIRDKEEFANYFKSLTPFPKDIGKKLMNSTKDVTASVIYGQVIIGIIQGLVSGIGFFIFGASNALLLTFLAMVVGILPIIGPALVWVPVVIYLLISGNNVAAIGITIFGIASITIDNFLRPIIVSKKMKMNSLLVFIGMVGGLFIFGILGFVLGPLIIAYLIIFLEVYRNKRLSGLIMREEKNKK